MCKKILNEINSFLEQTVFKLLSDEAFLKIYYSFFIGRRLDLEHPKGYNEKLQWIKLHDRNVEYIDLVDKYRVKQVVAHMIGEEYIVPIVAGPWKNVDDIEIEKLPKQFVLKVSHDSGGVIICRDKD